MVKEFLDISGLNKFLELLRGTFPFFDAFKGATSTTKGDTGLVPAPTKSDTAKILKGDGTWAEVLTSDREVVTSSSQPSGQKDGDIWISLGGG